MTYGISVAVVLIRPRRMPRPDQEFGRVVSDRAAQV